MVGTRAQVPSIGAALNAIFGSSSDGAALGDPHRRSFRRKSIRNSGQAIAIAAAVAHIVSIVFIVAPRGRGGLDAITAFMWSLFFILPTLALHALVGLLFGMLLGVVLLGVGGVLFGALGRGRALRWPVMAVVLGALGLLLCGGLALVLDVYNPFTAISAGVAVFVTALVPSISGAVWGVLLARRLHAYLADRLAS